MGAWSKSTFITLLSLATAASAQEHPGREPPVAVYWVSAQTSSGMLAGLMGGGGRPTMGSMFGMMVHGGPDPNAINHTLRLQLGSLRSPEGAPAAEHDPPAGLGVGPALPLVSPTPDVATRQSYDETPRPPQQYQRPKGRMLIFWGCGDHVGPNQPYVIDFATIGQNPAALMGLMRGVEAQPMEPPSPSRATTYGEWPNDRSTVAVPANGSLVGDHLVHGDYSPDIHFALSPDQDFLAPLGLQSGMHAPDGGVVLAWTGQPNVLGYFASLAGASGDGDIVMWSSSAGRTFSFAQPDYMAPEETRRLVDQGRLLPPDQTHCTVPAEVVQATGRAGIVQLSGYGGEANFAGPRPLHPQWVVKVRYRTTASALLGQPGGQPQERPSMLHGLGMGVLGGLLH